MHNFDVMVVGGGLSGLCLAHGLRKGGVRVAVYERDPTADARPQGTRLHINPVGSRALHSCLPERTFALFRATSGEYAQGFSVLDKHLKELSVKPEGETAADTDPACAHRSADRMILRRVLLTGLEDVTHFGKQFSHYETALDGKVVAHFQDGASARADLLVGADGVRSRVRGQYLPDAEPVDTGAVMVGGKIAASDEVQALLPRAVNRGGVMIVPGDAPSVLVLASWKPDDRELQAIAGMEGVPGLPPGDEKGYAVFGFCAGRDYLALTDERMRGHLHDVKQTLLGLMENWHPDLRRLAELIEPAQSGVVKIFSSRQIPAWKPTKVTLIGDAIHSMTPFMGSGANTALKDASILCENLLRARLGEVDVLTAIERYEHDMRGYAFDAARASMETMSRLLDPPRAP
jgi:2-polyprenyl-6-methoxyphenol hydroxylase-like FAD-dependent oxidoreductase